MTNMENPRKHNTNSNVSNLTEITTRLEGVLQMTSEIESNKVSSPDILFIEPFYTGSHQQLIDLLHKNFPKSRLISLTGKKWPWRARCSALILSNLIPQVTTEKYLFSSSVLSLAELLGLRPDLQKLKKIVYFHENQFVYPIRQVKDRDVQFAYNQITTCLVADEIIFNSEFNLRSLLDNLNKIVKLFPDYRPKDMQLQIQPKCKVLYFPIEYPQLSFDTIDKFSDEVLVIVWPHRWEFDKSPEAFIDVLYKLKLGGGKFQVHMLGGHFADVPDICKEVSAKLKDEIITFGFVESKKMYYNLLGTSHVVVSTAIHEFFGVAMLEATYCGCFPLAPNRLVYPEIYPSQCLYKDENDLVNKLTAYCKDPGKASRDHQELNLDFKQFSVGKLLPEYEKLFS